MDRATDPRPRNVGIAVLCLGLAAVVTLPFSAPASGMMALLAYMLFRGHDWARIIFLLLVLFVVYTTLPNLRLEIASDPLHGSARVAVMALDLLAICLLFMSTSNAWFSGRSYGKSIQPGEFVPEQNNQRPPESVMDESGSSDNGAMSCAVASIVLAVAIPVSFAIGMLGGYHSGAWVFFYVAGPLGAVLAVIAIVGSRSQPASRGRSAVTLAVLALIPHGCVVLLELFAAYAYFFLNGHK